MALHKKTYDEENSDLIRSQLADFSRAHPGAGRPTGDRLPDSSAPAPRIPDRPEGAIFLDARTGHASPVARLPLADPSGGPTFSVDRFADALRDRLIGNCVGWAFVINLNGQEAASDGDGDAIVAGDTDSGTTLDRVPFTPDTRVMIASVSKTITAVAVLRLLDQLNLALGTRIWPFLPQDWSLGPGVSDLTFEHLLRHKTGMTVAPDAPSDPMTYEGLEAMIAQGATPDAPRAYFNGNFALFRVIVPALWRGVGLVAANNDNAVASAFFYAVYIIEEVFGRMNGAIGQNASISPLDARPTRYYSGPGATQGIDFPDWTLSSGGNSWHMTARELAAFMAFITYDNNVLSEPQRTLMDNLRLGWRRANTYPGMFGNYWGHGGVIDWNPGTLGRVRTGVMKFNIQVEASLVVNSGLTTPGVGNSASTLLWQAYDAAWT